MTLSKKSKIVLSVIVVLVAIRLILPYFVLKTVNKTLANIEEYHGHIDDLSFSLYRGGFNIYDLKIEKDNSNIPVPFFLLKEADVSIHWGALLKGSLVAEVILNEPNVNFAIDETGEESQTGTETNWVETLEELTPLDINLNLFSINNGSVTFKDFSQDPMVDIYLKDLDIKATNLSNVIDDEEKYPANITASAESIGTGKLSCVSHLNILKTTPDFNVDFKLENANLTSLNTFTDAYANFDFEEGVFSVYSEVIMEDGSYKGYVKPILDNVDIIKKGSDKDKTLLNRGWQLFLDSTLGIFKNHKKNRFATKAPISGNIQENNVNGWKAFINTIKNAFFKVFSKEIDEEL